MGLTEKKPPRSLGLDGILLYCTKLLPQTNTLPHPKVWSSKPMKLVHTIMSRKCYIPWKMTGFLRP